MFDRKLIVVASKLVMKHKRHELRNLAQKWSIIGIGLPCSCTQSEFFSKIIECLPAFFTTCSRSCDVTPSPSLALKRRQIIFTPYISPKKGFTTQATDSSIVMKQIDIFSCWRQAHLAHFVNIKSSMMHWKAIHWRILHLGYRTLNWLFWARGSVWACLRNRPVVLSHLLLLSLISSRRHSHYAASTMHSCEREEYYMLRLRSSGRAKG